LEPGTKTERAYGEGTVFERHRHRWEVNNSFRQSLADAGLIASGCSPDGQLVEIMELTDHPFFVGVQFHPEFKSRPTRPHPLFRDFVGAAVNSLPEGAQRTLPLNGSVDVAIEPAAEAAIAGSA
jgi:CTP synthase